MDETHHMKTRSTYVPKNASYSKEVKLSTVDKVNRGIWTLTEAAKKVHCNLQTVINWVHHVENGKEMHDFSHRPPYISAEHKKELISDLDKLATKNRGELKRKFGTELQNKVNETRQEQNKPPVKVSKKYIGEFIHKEKINKGNAEVETNAERE